jgi:hypothetical protein
VARDDITHGIVADMTHVRFAGGVGEHFEDIGFGRIARLSRRFGAENVLLGPLRTPMRLGGLGVISLGHGMAFVAKLNGLHAMPERDRDRKRAVGGGCLTLADL